MTGIRSYRSAAFQDTFNSHNRFIVDFGFCRNPSNALDKHSEGVGTAFIHECSRHNHVIHKVTGQKPVIRVYISLSTDQTKPVTTALRIDNRNPVDQFHAPPGELE